MYSKLGFLNNFCCRLFNNLTFINNSYVQLDQDLKIINVYLAYIFRTIRKRYLFPKMFKAFKVHWNEIKQQILTTRLNNQRIMF